MNTPLVDKFGDFAINVFASRSENNREIAIYDRRDKFMASYRDGRWVDDQIFSGYELDEFTVLQDDAEISRILDEARRNLGKPVTSP